MRIGSLFAGYDGIGLGLDCAPWRRGTWRWPTRGRMSGPATRRNRHDRDRYRAGARPAAARRRRTAVVPVTDHDPLCRLNLSDCDHGNTRVCHCSLIARVRADERERLADLVQMKFSMTSARTHDDTCVCILCAINSTVDAAVDYIRGGAR